MYTRKCFLDLQIKIQIKDRQKMNNNPHLRDKNNAFSC